MQKYLCHSIIGSFILFALVLIIFLVGAFILWDIEVLLLFWKATFATFRICLVVSFLVCIVDWEE